MEEPKKEISEGYFVRSVIYQVLYINDLACNSILEMFDVIKTKDKQSQKLFKAMYKRTRNYQMQINRIVRDLSDSFADYNDKMDDIAQPILERLRQKILHTFEEHKVEDAEYLSYVEMARTLFGYADQTVKERVKEGAKLGINLVNLQSYRLEDMHMVMDNYADWAYRHVEDIDLSGEEFSSIFREFHKKMCDFEMINKFLDETINKKD